MHGALHTSLHNQVYLLPLYMCIHVGLNTPIHPLLCYLKYTGSIFDKSKHNHKLMDSTIYISLYLSYISL